MCRKRSAKVDGIRFLDEEPNPVPTAPSSKPPKVRKRREWPIGVLSFLAVVGTGIAIRNGEAPDASARDVIEQQVIVGPRPRVEVEAVDGSIRVERREDDAVSCRIEVQARGQTEEEARRTLGLIRPTITHGPDSLRVRVNPTGGPGRWSGRVEIRLGVPEGTDLRVVARDGSVRVEDVRGSVAVRTTNGRIEVEDASGPIVLESSNGAIECEADDAMVSARSSNGSITFRGSLAPGTSRMVTDNGAVSLELPEHAHYRVDAMSRNGRVESEFPIDGGGFDRVALAGIDGEGPTTRVEVRTVNGAIRVEGD